MKMKTNQKTNEKQTPLTDAELQQATGGTIAGAMLKRNCEKHGDSSSCTKPCKWKEGKNGHYCTY